MLAAAALTLFHSYTVTDAQQLFLTPLLQDARGWDIYRLDESGSRVPLTPQEASEATGTVYLSRVLEPGFEASGYTTLELDGPASVFLDGALLYTTTPGSGGQTENVQLPERYTVPAAGEIPRLTLPPGYGGKTLTLAFSRDSDRTGTPAVILSSRAAEAALTAAQANQLAMPAAAYMTAAFLLLGLFFYGGFQNRWDWPTLLLTLAAALQAFYQLRDYGLRLSYHSALDIRAAALIPPLFTALPLAYLLCRMERGRGRLRAVLILLPAAVALAPELCYLCALPLPGVLQTLCGQPLVRRRCRLCGRRAGAGGQRFAQLAPLLVRHSPVCAVRCPERGRGDPARGGEPEQSGYALHAGIRSARPPGGRPCGR